MTMLGVDEGDASDLTDSLMGMILLEDLCMRIDWVAVKGLKLGYHNGCI